MRMRTGRKLEENAGVQIALSAFMLALIACLLGWNLPDGRAHDKILTAVGPVVRTMGLEQGWSVFAPDPRNFSQSIHATITYQDGHTKVWRPPHNGLFLSPYRNYRWEKAGERIYATASTWEQTVDWLDREQGPGITKIVLTRDFQFVTVPGDKRPRPKPATYDIYTKSYA